MRCTSRLRALPLLLLAAAAAPACVDMADDVAWAPSGVASAGFTPGLTTGCDGAVPPVGRLRGFVYPIPRETRFLPDFDLMRPAGMICMDRLAVSERKGYPGFPGIRHNFEWFAIDFQGVFLADAAGPHRFRLTSDDGAKLFIDGALVIDNDGYHAIRTSEGAAALGPGPHSIAVPYWQGPGPMALVLEVARPGEGYRIFRVDLPLPGSAE
jgi:hypothetical protein